MEADIVRAFHATARLTRADLFGAIDLTPRMALEDAHTAAPGWVGSRWEGGTLLVGINPGGGGDSYRRNPTDDRLYALLRAFRDAEGLPAQAQALERLSREWIEINRGHNIWRVIGAILEATGEDADEVAFMNILPFRTRCDAKPPATVLRAAWEKSAKPQILALKPSRIIALGKKAWDELSRFQLPLPSELILIKRAIGDSYIPAESQEVLRQLALRSG